VATALPERFSLARQLLVQAESEELISRSSEMFGSRPFPQEKNFSTAAHIATAGSSPLITRDIFEPAKATDEPGPMVGQRMHLRQVVT
jgi:hypothetical protein